MLIEVTEKEALEIYSQRYFKTKGKKKYIPLAILALAVIGALLVMTYVHEWLGVATLAILASPSVYITLKMARASGKHAQSQIEEKR